MSKRFRSYQAAHYGLLLINLITIAYVSYVKIHTPDSNGAELSVNIEKKYLSIVPLTPEKTLVCALILYSVLSCTTMLRESRSEKWKEKTLYMFCISDYIIALIISVLYNFEVKHVLLIPIIHGVTYIHRKEWKSALLVPVILSYYLLDHHFISIMFPLDSVFHYLRYFESPRALYLEGLLYLFQASGAVCFISLFLLKTQVFKDESARIAVLNRELTENRDKLVISNIQLQVYSEMAAENAKLKERNRLTVEIHDTIGHTLTGLSLGLAAAEQLVHEESTMLKNQLSRLNELANKGLIDVQRSLKELQPDILSRNNLIEAIETLKNEIANNSNKRVEFICLGIIPSLRPSVQQTLFRCVQEGLTNAFRHGRADCVIIKLDGFRDHIVLNLSDNGQGCKDFSAGMGLRGMKERVSKCNGVMNIQTAEGEGFILEIVIPLDGDSHGD